MAGQCGLFDTDERLRWLSAAGDPLERLAAVVDFELFRPELDAALGRSDRAKGGRPPYDAVMMFRVLVLQTLYTLSDDQTEYQLRDRLREQLVRAGAFERLFVRFDAALSERGYLAMGGQIVDATIVEARRPRLTQAEKDVVKGGGIPANWKPARTRQIDREGRWTLKRGKKKPAPPGGSARASAEIAVPMFGYKNHVGIDREHGFVRRFKVTDAFGAALEPVAGWPLTPRRRPARRRARPGQHRERGLGRYGVPLGRQHRDARQARPEAPVPAPQAPWQTDAAPRRPRQRPPRAHPVPRRACLRRPEVPVRPGDPHGGQGSS